MSITAIISGYNRPLNMGAIHCAIEGQTVKATDVWCWYNKGDKEQTDLYDVKEARLSWNSGFYGRFAYALLAKTEYVAIFDDDSIPGERWFENCLETMKTNEGILGSIGIMLAQDDYENHMSFGWRHPNDGIVEVDLVGHAWFFKRDWLRYFWSTTPYTFDNAEDIHFSAMAYMNGVKTFVPPHPMEDKTMWGSIHGLELGSDQVASWKSNPRHGSLRSAAVRHYIHKGYTPVYKRDYKD